MCVCVCVCVCLCVCLCVSVCVSVCVCVCEMLSAMPLMTLLRVSTEKGQFAAAKFHCRTALNLCLRFVPDSNLRQLQSDIRELHKHCTESMAVIQQSVG